MIHVYVTKSVNILTVLSLGRAQLKATYLNSKKIIFTPVLNKSYVHCDFSKWFIDYLKNLNCMFVVVDI